MYSSIQIRNAYNHEASGITYLYKYCTNVTQSGIAWILIDVLW